MKKNKKKIWKLLIQGFVYLAMLGVFAGFVVFLNRSAQTETEDVMDWEPEAAQGIPEAGSLQRKIRRLSCILSLLQCSLW